MCSHGTAEVSILFLVNIANSCLGKGSLVVKFSTVSKFGDVNPCTCRGTVLRAQEGMEMKGRNKRDST